MKKVLYRQLKRARVGISNRLMATRLLRDCHGALAGAMALDVRSAELTVIRARAVVLATGAAGRLGLPASGYPFGTYENPTNAGDGYSMAYHAGAELTGIEVFQINPLIKDHNGPVCAYVTGPMGGYTANAHGERFIESDYWSGQMMLEFHRELASENGPVFLKLNHLAEETITQIENILHTNERPSRGRFHEGRSVDYRRDMVEMHISEIGLCSGHSASRVWVDEHAATTVPGLYAAGDLACVPHNYMLGAFVYGAFAGRMVPGARGAGSGPGRGRDRGDARPCAPRSVRRPAPRASGIQVAAARQRLPPAPEGDAQDGDRGRAHCRDSRGHESHACHLRS